MKRVSIRFSIFPSIMKFVYFLFIILMAISSSCQNEKSLLGDSYFKAGEYEKAIEAYNNYLKLKPKHVKTIYNRGRCYQELGKFNKAMEDFDKVIKLDAYNENALLSIGQEFYRKGEYKSASFYSEKVLERDPGNAMAYYLKGRANHRQGHFREAISNYNTVLNLSPEFGEAYFHRSAVKLYLKQNRSACADLKKAVDLKVDGAEEALKKNCR